MSDPLMDPRPELVAEDELAKLTGDVTISPGSLVIRYRFESRTDARLLLFDGIQTAEAGPRRVDLNLAYVSYDGPSTLSARRVVPPAPTRCTVGFGIVPWLRIVRSGAGVTGRIRLRFPIEEYNPYFPPDFRAEREERRASRLRLELAYVRDHEAFRVRPIPDLPAYHTFRRTGEAPDDVVLRSLMAECALQLEVPVLERVDRPFERV